MSDSPDEPADPHPEPDRDPDRRTTNGMFGVAAVTLLGLLCCAGPTLLAAGALGALGSWLSNPWLIAAAAAALVLATAGWALRRHGARDRAPTGHPVPPTPTAGETSRPDRST